MAIGLVVTFAAAYLVLASWYPMLRRWSSLYLAIALLGSVVLLMAALVPLVVLVLVGPDSE